MKRRQDVPGLRRRKNHFQDHGISRETRSICRSKKKERPLGHVLANGYKARKTRSSKEEAINMQLCGEKATGD